MSFGEARVGTLGPKDGPKLKKVMEELTDYSVLQLELGTAAACQSPNQASFEPVSSA